MRRHNGGKGFRADRDPPGWDGHSSEAHPGRRPAARPREEGAGQKGAGCRAGGQCFDARKNSVGGPASSGPPTEWPPGHRCTAQKWADARDTIARPGRTAAVCCRFRIHRCWHLVDCRFPSVFSKKTVAEFCPPLGPLEGDGGGDNAAERDTKSRGHTGLDPIRKKTEDKVARAEILRLRCSRGHPLLS